MTVSPRTALIITVFVAAANALAAWWGLFSGSVAVALFLTVELLLCCLTVTVVLRRFLQLRQDTGSYAAAVDRLAAEFLPVRIARAELWVLSDLVLLLRRCQQVPPGAPVLSATTGLWWLPTAFTCATAIEIIALELLLPWPLVRLIVLVLSLYGVVWLWGVTAAKWVWPHYIDPDTGVVCLRDGRTTSVVLDLTDGVQVTRRRDFSATHTQLLDNQLILGSGQGSNLHIALRHPHPVAVARGPWFAPRQDTASSIALWVDDPAACLAAMRDMGPFPAHEKGE